VTAANAQIQRAQLVSEYNAAFQNVENGQYSNG